VKYSIAKHQHAAAPSVEQVKWLSIFGFWTFFAFLNANQIYFEMLHSPDMHHSWWRIAVWQLLVWYVWGGLSPLVLTLGRAWPVEGARWWRGLLVHLPAAALFSAFHSFMTIVLTVTIRPFDVWTVQRPFLFQFVANLKGFFLFNFVIYWAILGVGYAFDYRKKYRERESQASELKAQLAQAQLEALKMQLHPHFLFNTLHTIAGLVRTNERDPAVNMIAGLSDLLRHALDSAAEQEVPLGEEVKFIELYVDIQMARFSDRLTVRMEIAPDTLEARVPNLILQPLVENAIRHGVSVDDIQGSIVVEAFRHHDKLMLKVTDNGPGLAAGWRLEQNEGIGLANTVDRLRHLYGDNQRFELVNGVNGGTVATVTIPFQARWSE
jgi:two-component system LytT family sensor kinase